ncbi:MAG: amino acid permease [Actinomycetales bacterium mxb001]|nr:MAG: amino acid permease [Actinomycetales bacterium mxb001]
MASTLFRLKPIQDAIGHGELKRTMGRSALLFFSVGSIIGSGIFVILGVAIPKAGPAVLLSFLLAAVAALFSALSYAELASAVPASGSSYSYAYVTLGEIVAWAVGWMLMLEYGVAVAAVSVGWGEYLNEFLGTFGITIPAAIASPPGEGGVFNVPALIVVAACTFLLIRGASESARWNTIMVMLKIAILVFFCIVAFTAFDGNNLEPFLPLGLLGVTAAAGQVFFSYIGFDAASTAGEEAKNPKKDLPIAIIGSLAVVTALYLLVTLAALGAQDWKLDTTSSSEAVLSSIANTALGASWPGALIALGAIISIFSVVLVTLYGQTRILFAMGRDGLLPKAFTRVNPRTQTPVANTIIVGVLVAIPASLVSLGQLAEATSIGTLGAFAVVNIGVIVLRRRRPDLPRGFTTPLFPLMPILGLILIAVIVLSLQPITWLVFAIWMTVGFIVYFAYSRRHSVLGKSGT